MPAHTPGAQGSDQPRTDPLATLAVSGVEPGMTVGLGTGRAASRAIRALAARVALEGFALRCVATSDASARLAAELGLHVAPLGSVDAIDHLFDGADEVDPELRMLKGRGGAMTREKIAAHASAFCVYLIDDSKLVSALGQRNPVPVEVLPDALACVRARLLEAGLAGVVRAAPTGGDYRTDNGNPVLDLSITDDVSAEELAMLLQDTPGVVGHGLFLDEADEVLIESGDGAIERRVRD